MKTKLSLTVTSDMLLLLNACGVAVVPGSGKIVKETRVVSNYSQVVFSAPGELTIEQNGHEGLVIEADDNLLGYIRTRVQGNVLYIYEEPDIIHLYPSKPIRYTLDVTALTGVTLNGSGVIRSNELIASNLDFDLNGSGDILVAAVKSQSTTLELDGSGGYQLGSIITGQFKLSLDGSGDITMQEVVTKTANLGITGSGKLAMADVIADSLDVKISGSGDSTLSGQVNQQAITIHSSGNYSASSLQSQAATVKITGSGNSKIWVTDELDITITGSGDLTYRGEPAITQAVTGSGNVTSLAGITVQGCITDAH